MVSRAADRLLIVVSVLEGNREGREGRGLPAAAAPLCPEEKMRAGRCLRGVFSGGVSGVSRPALFKPILLMKLWTYRGLATLRWVLEVFM